MKATTIPMEDDRGFITLCFSLLQTALTPPESTTRKVEKKPSWLERLDRWAARGRQRQLERYLASSGDVFELESRMRAAERLGYY